jgi:hypothetical protein
VYDSTIQDKWKDILSAKYSNSLTHASPFRKEVVKYRDLINLEFKKQLGSGYTVLFWTDR